MSGRLALALDALASARPVVLERTLVIAAQLASPEWIAFGVRHASGPLRCIAGGEAEVQLVRLAQLPPVAVVGDLDLDADEARRFAGRHGLPFVSAGDLRATVTRLADTRLPTRYGDFQAEAFATLEHPDRHHLALVHGDLSAGARLVRVHVACPAGERFGALLCDCASRLRDAMREVAAAEAGVLVYLRGPDEALHACTRGASPDHEVADAILHALRVGETAAA